MYNPIKSILRALYNWAQSDHPTEMSNRIGRSSRVRVSTRRDFTFTVTNAAGGCVVTVSSYNEKTDTHTDNVYIITDQEDMGTELAEIITLEGLAR